MGFWGFEVKPGKPQTCNPRDEQGKIHVTQATLGAGSSKEKSVIQCSIGDNKTPIILCSLLPNKIECCPLNLEFDDNDELVEFSVTGDRSIHLSGFLEYYEQEEDDYEQEEDDYEQDVDDSDGIDIGESESDNSGEYDSQEDDELDQFEDFLDTNLEMYRNASVPKSGVVIEEIEDEDNEDEDGLPIPKEKAHEPENKMDLDTDEQVSNKKRKANASEQGGAVDSANNSKKKKKQKEKKKEKNASNEEADEGHTGSELKKQDASQISSNTKSQNATINNTMSEVSKTPAKSTEKKNKKKKKNSGEEDTVEKKAISSSVEKQTPVDSKSSQVRTHSNGLVVEELSMGKPNGKRADPGKTVSVRYIGKLQKNGKIFDSNIGKSPFKFRLGVGQVIKGWDVGVNGMRVGDKRKITIPPSMGYGAKGAGGQIPPNAWLTFDVELLNVQ